MGCKSSRDGTPNVPCTKCSEDMRGLDPVNSKKGKKVLMSTGVKVEFPVKKK